MSLFHTILVAADFSEPSREAFRLACALADEHTTRLRVVHVLEKLHLTEQAIGFGEHGELVLLDEESMTYHESVREHMREFYVPACAVNVEYEVSDGQPSAAILAAAERSQCDLIVMGTHGLTGLRRLVAGSVAESVLRAASCPVLALRTLEHPVRVEPGGVILHPVELEEPSLAALRTARSLARDRGARLVLVHVAPLDLSINNRSTVVFDLGAYERKLERMRTDLDGPDLKFPVEARIVRGNVANEIVRTAQLTGSGLIVMGAHGRRGLERVLFGSAAEGVMRGAPCPVLAVKEAASVFVET